MMIKLYQISAFARSTTRWCKLCNGCEMKNPTLRSEKKWMVQRKSFHFESLRKSSGSKTFHVRHNEWKLKIVYFSKYSSLLMMFICHCHSNKCWFYYLQNVATHWCHWQLRRKYFNQNFFQHCTCNCESRCFLYNRIGQPIQIFHWAISSLIRLNYTKCSTVSSLRNTP